MGIVSALLNERDNQDTTAAGALNEVAKSTIPGEEVSVSTMFCDGAIDASETSAVSVEDDGGGDDAVTVAANGEDDDTSTPDSLAQS
jgi:hypothetical protein